MWTASMKYEVISRGNSVTILIYTHLIIYIYSSHFPFCTSIKLGLHVCSEHLIANRHSQVASMRTEMCVMNKSVHKNVSPLFIGVSLKSIVRIEHIYKRNIWMPFSCINIAKILCLNQKEISV